VVLAARLQGLERDGEDAAESLGASRWVVFRRVTLPLAWPALRSAALVVFVLSLGDLGNPLLVGGEHPVLAREVYTRAVGGGDPAGASGLALVLVALSLAVWGLDRGRAPAAAGAATVRGHAVPSRWRTVAPGVGWPLTVVAAAVAAAVIAVGLVVVVGSLVAGGDGRPSLVRGSVLAGFDARAVGVSVALALLAGMLGSVLSLALAYVLERPRLPLAAPVRALAGVPAPVPGVVLGLGYLLALGGPPATVTLGLAALAASVVVSRLPVGLALAGAALRRIDPATESTALALGAGPRRTLARIVLPQLATTGVAAFALFFVHGLVSVVPVALFASAALEPAAVAALARAAGGAAGEACALVTYLLALVAVAAAVLCALAGRTRAAVLFL
jgi:iron(III) transport system permease protein